MIGLKTIMSPSLCFALLCVGASAMAAEPAGSDWPYWLGPNQDSKSLDKGLLKEWPSGGPKQLWKVTGIGTGYSSLAVAGGKVLHHRHRKGQRGALRSRHGRQGAVEGGLRPAGKKPGFPIRLPWTAATFTRWTPTDCSSATMPRPARRSGRAKCASSAAGPTSMGLHGIAVGLRRQGDLLARRQELHRRLRQGHRQGCLEEHGLCGRR